MGRGVAGGCVGCFVGGCFVGGCVGCFVGGRGVLAGGCVAGGCVLTGSEADDDEFVGAPTNPVFGMEGRN